MDTTSEKRQHAQPHTLLPRRPPKLHAPTSRGPTGGGSAAVAPFSPSAADDAHMYECASSSSSAAAGVVSVDRVSLSCWSGGSAAGHPQSGASAAAGCDSRSMGSSVEVELSLGVGGGGGRQVKRGDVDDRPADAGVEFDAALDIDDHAAPGTPAAADEASLAEDGEHLMRAYVSYSLLEAAHFTRDADSEMRQSLAKARRNIGRNVAAMSDAAAAGDKAKQEPHGAPLPPAFDRSSSVLSDKTVSGILPAPHYHMRQFQMALIYWQAHLKHGTLARSSDGKPVELNQADANEIRVSASSSLSNGTRLYFDSFEYLSECVDDWMPPTPRNLARWNTFAFFAAWEEYFITTVLLPIGVLFMARDKPIPCCVCCKCCGKQQSDDEQDESHGSGSSAGDSTHSSKKKAPRGSDFSRICRNAWQTWAFSLFHVAIPSSKIKQYSAWKRAALSAILTLFYLSLIVPIPLRYWALYAPFGGDLTSRIDCWFPPCLAALTNVCVAGHAAVAHTFDRKSIDPAEREREESTSDKKTNADKTTRRLVLAHDPTVTAQKALFASKPSEKDEAYEEQQRLLRHLSHRLPSETTSRFLQSPDELLSALCSKMKQHDYRLGAWSSIFFIFIGVAFSLLPNAVSVAYGGLFLGDCEAHTPLQRACPFPLGVMQFAVMLRIIVMAGNVYFFAYVLHQIAVYFFNKTLARRRLLLLLQRLLGSGDVQQLVNVQLKQIDAKCEWLDRGNEQAHSPCPFPKSEPGDLSRLPSDLSVWWSTYRFMDEIDRRDGWQVQVTLAWYATFVLFCCIIVLVAVVKDWTGIDQLVLYFSCAWIALAVGIYVGLILISGMQINQLPVDMHAAMREAEQRIVVALAIVQRHEQTEARRPSRAVVGVCSLQVGASLLSRFASTFSFTVLSNPFSVLMVPLTKTLISTAVVAGLTALSSVVAATVTGAIKQA